MFNLHEFKFSDSLRDDQTFSPSSKSSLQNTVSHSKQMIVSADSTGKAMYNSASKIQPQQTKTKLESLHAGKNEDALHRSRFNSLFQSETMTKTDHVATSPTIVGDSVVPRLLLKRKAAWSGMVGIRGSNDEKTDAEHNPDIPNAKVEPLEQKENATDSHAVRLHFQNQR